MTLTNKIAELFNYYDPQTFSGFETADGRLIERIDFSVAGLVYYRISGDRALHSISIESFLENLSPGDYEELLNCAA